MEIKFEYIFKDRDGKIHRMVFTLDQLEIFEMEGFTLDKRWTILARRLSTGLYDKNKKEIFCGDVVRYKHGGKHSNAARVVEWLTISTKNGWSIGNSPHWEVIGDIYTSPPRIIG